MNFNYYDDYSVNIQNPSGKTYKGTLTSPNTVECAVPEVKVGQWEIIIEETNKEEDDSTDQDNNMVDTEISPVKITVEGSMENLMSVDQDITVATDIAGLHMYFKDGTFVAEWTDTTCGNINIEIINAKNLQKIDSQTVKNNSYTCPISKDVEEILVTIVPTVSQSVQGAENTFKDALIRCELLCIF